MILLVDESIRSTAKNNNKLSPTPMMTPKPTFLKKELTEPSRKYIFSLQTS
jgi:hypothetical protein